MIRCKSYFNTKLIRMFGAGYELKMLEIIDRFLGDNAISVRLSLKDICSHSKVMIRRYKAALDFLQRNNIIFNWKQLIGYNHPNIIVPDDMYLVNPEYIRHINKTQFKKYLKRTANKIADTNTKCVVDEYWAVNLIPNYVGDEIGGFYIDSYKITTEYEVNGINKPIFSIY